MVGDFAGTHALSAVAAELTRRRLSVTTFYVSNVEQYLLDDSRMWGAWADNLLRLPNAERMLMIRAYLDQGRQHPAQLAGHRTTTVLQPFDSQSRRSIRVRPQSLLSLTEVGWLR